MPEVTKAEVDNLSVSRAAATADLPHDEKLAQLHQGTKTNKSRSKAVNGARPEVVDKLSTAIRELCTEGEFKDLVELGRRCIDTLTLQENPNRGGP